MSLVCKVIEVQGSSHLGDSVSAAGSNRCVQTHKTSVYVFWSVGLKDRGSVKDVT